MNTSSKQRGIYPAGVAERTKLEAEQQFTTARIPGGGKHGVATVKERINVTPGVLNGRRRIAAGKRQEIRRNPKWLRSLERALGGGEDRPTEKPDAIKFLEASSRPLGQIK